METLSGQLRVIHPSLHSVHSINLRLNIWLLPGFPSTASIPDPVPKAPPAPVSGCPSAVFHVSHRTEWCLNTAERCYWSVFLLFGIFTRHTIAGLALDFRFPTPIFSLKDPKPKISKTFGFVLNFFGKRPWPPFSGPLRYFK